MYTFVQAVSNGIITYYELVKNVKDVLDEIPIHIYMIGMKNM